MAQRSLIRVARRRESGVDGGPKQQPRVPLPDQEQAIALGIRSRGAPPSSPVSRRRIRKGAKQHVAIVSPDIEPDVRGECESSSIQLRRITDPGLRSKLVAADPGGEALPETFISRFPLRISFADVVTARKVTSGETGGDHASDERRLHGL